MLHVLVEHLNQTLIMVLFSGLVSVVLGITIGSILAATKYYHKNKLTHFILLIPTQCLSLIPGLILIIALLPIANWLSKIMPSTYAAIFILAIIGTAAMANKTLNVISSLPEDIFEMAKALGANRIQTFTMIVLPETIDRLIPEFESLLVYLVGLSTLVGVVGAGGLGQLAYEKGFISLEKGYILAISFMLLSIIYLIHILTTSLYNRVVGK